MAFPDDVLDVRTDLQIGGTWTDVSEDVYLRTPISISRGRPDEASRPDHCKATITFNNRLGKYSPRNPMSDLFGLIGRNTPVRVSVPAAEQYLRLPGDAGARASTPDASALDIVGDLDIRVDATLLNWSTGNDYVDLVGKWGDDGDLSWRLQLDPQGRPYLVWSPDGTAASGQVNFPDDLLPVPSSGRISVRVTLDVDNGAGENTATFYYSLTPGTAGPWTSFGQFSISGTTSIFSSTSPLRVGDVGGTVPGVPPVGKIHSLEIRDGIDGTVVAAPDFSVPDAGTGDFTDTAGRTWSMAGAAEVSDRDYRLHSEISSWPQRWDVSGCDRYVPVEAAGQLRRYGAGTDPLQSTLRRRVPSDPDTVAYWPCEDGADSVQAASGLSGGKPLTLTGVTWASDDSLPGSAALPATGAAAALSAAVPAPAGTPDGWHLELVYRVDTPPASASDVISIRLTGSLFSDLKLSLDGSDFTVTFVFADDSPDVTSTLPVPNSIGTWNRLILTAQQVTSSTMQIHFGVTTIGGTVYGVDSPTDTGTIGRISGLYATYGAAIEGLRIGHIGVFATTDTDIYDDADTAFDGEQAHVRIDRLCREMSMPVVFPAGTGPTAAMGPQRRASILDLLAECADADMGVLHEARDVAALLYRRRTSMYNQPARLALDYAVSGHVAPQLEPVDDDQAARNDITVSRVNGSSARQRLEDGRLSVRLPPDGIGPVPGGGTFNVQTDAQLPDMAGWLLHMGTIDQSRFPTVHVDLAAAPSLIEAAKAVDVGDRITIDNPPPDCGGPEDTLDLLVEGSTETLGLYDWDIVFNCAPGAPWTVTDTFSDGDDAPLADSDASELAADIAAADTELSVAVTEGPLWSTVADDYPVDVRIGGGEVATITACTGASSPQTMTATRGVNGVRRGWPAGASVQLVSPIIAAM